MGSLYQQFYKWGNLLLEKAKKQQVAGDPTAEEVVKQISAVIQACPEGAQRHSVPLYALVNRTYVARRCQFRCLTWILCFNECFSHLG